MTYVLEGLLAWVSAGGKVLHRGCPARREERVGVESVPIRVIILPDPFSADTEISFFNIIVKAVVDSLVTVR